MQSLFRKAGGLSSRFHPDRLCGSPCMKNSVLWWVILVAGSAIAAEPVPTYNRDIRPILSDNCFQCHGADAGSREARLRLDDRDAALKGGKSGLPAIVPGKPAESELILRTHSKDEDEVMPPADKKPRLAPADIAKLERWIAAGAGYEGHWAFTPPVAAAKIGTSKSKTLSPDATRQANPIDRLVTARLRRDGLTLSPAADPSTLARRLYLDTIGLPPTPADAAAFAESVSRDPQAAVENLLDRLLARPAYGEKWARHWLDVARYADSNGYEKDLPREQWAWRDWVISAYNRDLPYNQFIIEQIAGDCAVRRLTHLEK